MKLAYGENGSGFKPLPKDIVQAARSARKDRRERQVDRSDYEALCDSKVMSDRDVLRLVAARTGQKTLGREVSDA